MMRHGSLFSGIGGFDLAAQWMGWENVFHCEWNPFGQKVLHHYWPNAIQYHDITKTDFTIHRGTIDILTGGFPCQPYSMAGKRKGKDDERHLWPEMLRAIREIQPRWIVGENVLGLVNWNGGLVFDEVQADLEAEGYEVQPFVLPAAAVNAPHRRDRVWFVAYATDNGLYDQSTTGDNTIWKDYIQSRSQRERTVKGFSDERDAPDTDRFRFDRGIGEHEKQPGEGREYAQRDTQPSNGNGDATDTDQFTNYDKSNIRSNEEITFERGQETKGILSRFIDGGHCQNGDAADTDGIGRGKVIGERKGKSNVNDQISKTRAWENFPTQSPVCSGNDGIPTGLDGITFSKWRNESIKAYGNAVVPQVVYQIFKAIAQYESNL